MLLTPEGLKELKSDALGRGYVEKFPGSRGLRDTVAGVRMSAPHRLKDLADVLELARALALPRDLARPRVEGRGGPVVTGPRWRFSQSSVSRTTWPPSNSTCFLSASGVPGNRKSGR